MDHHCLDLKDWDGFAGTLTEDALGAYGTRAVGEPLRLEGRDAIVGTAIRRARPPV